MTPFFTSPQRVMRSSRAQPNLTCSFFSHLHCLPDNCLRYSYQYIAPPPLGYRKWSKKSCDAQCKKYDKNLTAPKTDSEYACMIKRAGGRKRAFWINARYDPTDPSTLYSGNGEPVPTLAGGGKTFRSNNPDLTKYSWVYLHENQYVVTETDFRHNKVGCMCE